MRRAVWMAMAALAAASCDQFFPIDDYVGPSSDGGATDAPRVVADAALDGGPPETGAMCPGAPGAIFCDDFDHGAFGAKWNATMPSSWNAADLALSDAQASSPPDSVHATVQPDASGQWATAMLGAIIPSVPTKLRASFDLYLEATDRGTEIPFVELDQGPDSYVFYLFLRAPGSTFGLGEDSDLIPDGGSLLVDVDGGDTSSLLGHWVRAVLDLDLGAKTYSLTIETPPGAAASPLAQNVPLVFAGATTVTARAGLYGMNTPTNCSFYVDNVVLESE